MLLNDHTRRNGKHIPKKNFCHVPQKACERMLSVALSVRAKKTIQMPGDHRMNRLWYVHTWNITQH